MSTKDKIKIFIKKTPFLLVFCQILYGIVTIVNPKLYRSGTGGTNIARYCYSVWLRHFVTMCENGVSPRIKSIAELGPGGSIGVGLAAILGGADTYYALDVVAHANMKKNLDIFNELVELYQNRTPIPDDNEFPEVGPKLHSYDFPTELLSEEILKKSLDANRINQIRAILNGENKLVDIKQNLVIKYVAPWIDSEFLKELNPCDVILSQAVLEHIDDLETTYSYMYKWLAPTGYMSHEIDFKSHGTSTYWNGHWGYSENVWKLIRGKRPFLINREPLSAHRELLKQNKFTTIKCDVRCNENQKKALPAIKRSNLKGEFQKMNDDDFHVQVAYILAKKQPSEVC